MAAFKDHLPVTDCCKGGLHVYAPHLLSLRSSSRTVPVNATLQGRHQRKLLTPEIVYDAELWSYGHVSMITLSALWLLSWCTSDTGARLVMASWKISLIGRLLSMETSWFANSSSIAKSTSCNKNQCSSRQAHADGCRSASGINFARDGVAGTLGENNTCKESTAFLK